MGREAFKGSGGGDEAIVSGTRMVLGRYGGVGATCSSYYDSSRVVEEISKLQVVIPHSAYQYLYSCYCSLLVVHPMVKGD